MPPALDADQRPPACSRFRFSLAASNCTGHAPEYFGRPSLTALGPVPMFRNFRVRPLDAVLLGDRLMVGQQVLALPVGVRVPLPQPRIASRLYSNGYGTRHQKEPNRTGPSTKVRPPLDSGPSGFREMGGNGRTRDQEPSPNIPLRAVRDTIAISSATPPADVSAAAAHGLEKRRRQSRSLDATKLKRYTGVARVTP